MKFVADEGVDRQIVLRLRQDGHTIWYVAEIEPGIPDNTVLELANKEKAILLTNDKDFGEIVFREHRVTSGVVLIRLAGLSASTKAEKVSIGVRKQEAEISKAFSVITPHAIRIRRRR